MHRTLLSNRRALSSAAAVAVATGLSAANSSGGFFNTSAEASNKDDLALTAADVGSKENVGPTYYTRDQVSERNGHTRPEMWMSYKGNVYDLTNFVQEHPGGGKFLREAVGGPLEPFWGYWAYHKSIDVPSDTLRTYWIGRIADEDEDEDTEDAEDVENDTYASEPKRDSMQIPLLQRPWCSETDLRALRSYFTANDAFYVRNHAPVPQLDKKNHEISFGCEEESSSHLMGRGISTKSLDLSTLKSHYKKTTIHSVLQCAGNRGSEMNRIKPTSFSGTPFEYIRCGMIGNASWSGVLLREVLLDTFPGIETFSDNDLDSYHVECEGVDGYACSVPLKHALDKTSDVLLAFEMNGEDLSPDHGYPIRVFIPGHAGARSVKWMHSIKLSRSECQSCWHTTYYKGPEGTSIQKMPMQSFMLSKQRVGQNSLSAKGVAWGGGHGKGISNVQVSVDEGQTWTDADLLPRLDAEEDESSREWSWVHFTAKVALKGEKSCSSDDKLPMVICRAVDGDGNIQPERPWYPKGYLYNGWHQL